MNTNTTHVGGAQKISAGEYLAPTYGGGEQNWLSTGAFTYTKIGSAWKIEHTDFTSRDLNGNPVKSFIRATATLKEAQRDAENYVRFTPENMARRREAALRGAMPISG